ncbi:MAG: helix-turn-helix domain-containing protein [Pseudonocardia sp.]|nr:helix-turn-helix domain-containing protein [Pseudonocardia sp.]
MVRALKDLQPDRSHGDRLGAELRRWRVQRSLSQDRLGVAICHSGALVSKVERAERSATLEFCERADTVLESGGALARLWISAAAELSTAVQSPTLKPIDDVRRALGCLGIGGEDETVPDLDRLNGAVAEVNRLRLDARYDEVAAMVPRIIVDLASAELHVTNGWSRRRVAALMVLALRAADGLAFKLGHHDLSARLVDLMTVRAQLSEDPALAAAAAYVGTETYFATGDLDTAHRALIVALDRVPGRDRTALHAARGALHMRAAVVSGRGGRTDDAAAHLGEARRATWRVPEGVYCGTAFGTASLRIHELAVAAELHDAAGVERATGWHPPSRLAAERRSHYYIELGRAQLDLGRFGDAHASLATARGIAPQHTSEHPQVRRVVAALRQTGPRPASAAPRSRIRTSP